MTESFIEKRCHWPTANEIFLFRERVAGMTIFSNCPMFPVHRSARTNIFAIEERHNPRGSLCPSIPPSSAGIKLSQCPNRTREGGEFIVDAPHANFRVFKWPVLVFVPVLLWTLNRLTGRRRKVASKPTESHPIKVRKFLWTKWHILQLNLLCPGRVNQVSTINFMWSHWSCTKLHVVCV